MKEIRSLRTKKTRTYDLGGGKRRIIIDPTLTVQPSAKDTFLSQGAPTTNYGSLTCLFMKNEVNLPLRPILEFDISELPAGATLISASLELYYYLYADNDPVGLTVWAYKLTRTDWVELQATWNNYKTATPWTSAGGDYVTSAPSGGSTTFPAGYGWMTWNVLAIVQDAFDGEISAEFLVKFAAEDKALGDRSRPYLYSNDYTDNLTLRPKLVIEYEVAVVGRSYGFIIG